MLVRILPYFVTLCLLTDFYLSSGQTRNIQNLKAITTSSNSVTLSWTVPTSVDDNDYVDYDLRYAQFPINTQNFELASKVETTASAQYGKTDTHTIDELKPGTVYYFAIRYTDFPGSFSTLSNVAQQTTPLAGSISATPNAVETALLTAETSQHTITVSNAGSGDLEVSFYAAGFISTTALPTILSPNESSAIELTIDASALTTGTYEEDFIIYTNDPVNPELHIPITLQVTDNGNPVARITGSTAVHFGEVYVGSYSQPSWTYVANVGSAPLIITDIDVTNPDIFIDEFVQADTLNTSEEYFLLFQYRPSTPGLGSGQIRIHSNDPANPVLEVSVSADCIESPVQLVLDKTSLSDTISIGQTSVQSFILGNEGIENLEFTINTWNLPSYMTITPLSGTLGQYESTELEVVFDASGLTPGVYEYEITIENNDPRYFGAYFLPVKYVVEGAMVNNFTLLNFKTNQVVTTFRDRVVLDVADPEINNYTIQANATSQTSSVKFVLDNNEVNTDNSAPYRINNWVLPVLAQGDHLISAQAIDPSNTVRGSLTSTISIISSATITDFDVVNAAGVKLMDLEDGGIVDLSSIGTNSINIVANTNISTVRSVKFVWGGTTARIDNVSPYALKGTSSGDTFWSATPGNYTLTASPYMKLYGWGPVGVSKTIRFQVVRGSEPTLAEAQQKENAGEPVITGLLSEEKDIISLYPVPVEDELQISLKINTKEAISINIVDLQGKLLQEKNFNPVSDSSPYTINTRDLVSGFYIVQIQQPDGRILSKRFVKN